MLVIMNSLIYSLREQNVHVTRTISGRVMTSLDMHGFSISLLKLTNSNESEILELVDLKVSTPSWPSPTIPQLLEESILISPHESLYEDIGFSEDEDKNPVNQITKFVFT